MKLTEWTPGHHKKLRDIAVLEDRIAETDHIEAFSEFRTLRNLDITILKITNGEAFDDLTPTEFDQMLADIDAHEEQHRLSIRWG